MKYSINVALNGKHLFATHDRSIKTQHELLTLLVLFDAKFPESEGYAITASSEESYSTTIDVTQALRSKKISKDKRTLYQRLFEELKGHTARSPRK
jgi:hypothetical protein